MQSSIHMVILDSRNKPLFFVVLPVLASILLGIFVVLLINVLVYSIFK